MPITKKVIKANTVPRPKYVVLGIASHEKSYVLSWELGKILELEFAASENIEIVNRKDDVKTVEVFEASDNHILYRLISNISTEGTLLPSQKNIDFLLLMHHAEKSDGLQVLERIKASRKILTAFIIEEGVRDQNILDQLLVF